ncbi:MAG: hypothetical protein PHG87_01465 [Candidatus Omnitrophica bacterium]|nr:hypothetical protein [Candidatus Omnitrophota bacterium]
MAKKQISNLDIDPALNEIERVNKSIFFIAGALPEYPHDGGMEELSMILECLSDRAQKAIEEIKVTAGL